MRVFFGIPSLRYGLRILRKLFSCVMNLKRLNVKPFRLVQLMGVKSISVYAMKIIFVVSA